MFKSGKNLRKLGCCSGAEIDTASNKTRPANDANALLTPALELFISFTIKVVIPADIGISNFKRNTRWGGRAAARTATAASCVYFASRGVVASTKNAETLEDGVRKDSVEYKATRWSGKAAELKSGTGGALRWDSGGQVMTDVLREKIQTNG
jgi:hypothetical protein